VLLSQHRSFQAFLVAAAMGVLLLTGIADAKPKIDLPTTAVEAYNQGVYHFQLAQGQSDRGNARGQEDLLNHALTLFHQAEKLDPLMAEAFSNEGFALLTLKRYNPAILAFNKALALNPNHLNSLNGLATTQSLAGKSQEAIATLKTLTTLAPGEAQYWFNQGAIYQKLKRTQEAEEAYRQALKMDPQHQRSWFNLATLYENQHRFEDATDAYTHTKQLDVSSSIGLEALHRLETIKKAKTTAPGPQARQGGFLYWHLA
jgi:Flp pilus assembly protein TadD